MPKEKTRLNLNIDQLLPGEAFPIGSQQVYIRPLGLLQIKMITSKIRGLFKTFTDEGITFSATMMDVPDPDDSSKIKTLIIPPNFKDPDKLIIIAEVLVVNFPEVLEELTGIHQDDLDILPIDIIVSLLDKCLDVNIKSKESLLGNWKSLADKLEKMGLMEKKAPVKPEKPEKLQKN